MNLSYGGHPEERIANDRSYLKTAVMGIYSLKMIRFVRHFVEVYGQEQLKQNQE